MRITHTLAGVGLVLTMMHPAQARAQQMSPSLHFGGSAGVGIPLSDLSTFVQTGYYISGLVQGRPGDAPFELRGEAIFSSYAAKSTADAALAGGRAHDISSINGDAVYSFDQTHHSGAYAIGGLGLYHIDRGGITSENDFGINVGAGYRWQLVGMSTFLEARYHYIGSPGTPSQTLPITFGIVF